MSMRHNFIAPFIVIAGLLMSTGTSGAAAEGDFRLSNFSSEWGRICVFTDVDKVCSELWPSGKSEVLKVKANTLSGWHCEADNGQPSKPIAVSGKFNRGDVKEFVLEQKDGKFNIAFK